MDNLFYIEPAALASLHTARELGMRLPHSPSRGPARERAGSTAIIDVIGVINRGRTWLSYFTSECIIGELIAEIEGVTADPSISKLIINIDSAGGTALGLSEIVRAIDDCQAAGKLVIAFSSGLLCSAAYFVAAACRRVIVAPDALIGSIGTLQVVTDASVSFNRVGLEQLVFSTGDVKGAGVFGAPVTDAHKASFQQTVDIFGLMFLRHVAERRRLSSLDRIEDGGVFSGRQAHALGLVDEVGTLRSILPLARPSVVSNSPVAAVPPRFQSRRQLRSLK